MLKMTVPPKRRQLQFMLSAVTVTVDGKKLKNSAIITYIKPTAFTIGPITGPIFQGPQWSLSLIGSFRSRLCRIRAMGILYEAI
jgi:hypothetical protein